jgi:ferredoxin
MPRVTFLELDGGEHDVVVAAGSSVLQAAKAHDLSLEGTCGGSMICATCHVRIEPHDRAKLPPPTEEEEATLGLAIGVTADSRLGCQIRLTDAMDGMRIRLTSTMHAL